MGAAAVGAVLERARWRTWRPTVAPAVYVSLVTAVFPGSLRFRLPAHAGLAVLAGVAYVALSRRSAPVRTHAASSFAKATEDSALRSSEGAKGRPRAPG